MRPDKMAHSSVELKSLLILRRVAVADSILFGLGGFWPVLATAERGFSFAPGNQRPNLDVTIGTNGTRRCASVSPRGVGRAT